jgi:cell division protein FtsL
MRIRLDFPDIMLLVALVLVMVLLVFGLIRDAARMHELNGRTDKLDANVTRIYKQLDPL